MKILLFFDSDALQSGHLRTISRELEERLTEPQLKIPWFSFETQQSFENADQGPQVDRIFVLETSQDTVSSEATDNFVRFMGDPYNRETYLTAVHLLNRLDLSGTLRLLDREALVRLSVLRILDYLSRENPSAVVFPTTPHTFFDYLLFRLSKFLEIPALFFQPVPFAPLMIPFTDLGQRKPLSAGNVGNLSAVPVYTQQLKVSLNRILSGESPRYIDNQKRMGLRARSLTGRLRAIFFSIRWLRERRFPESLDFLGSSLSRTALSPALALLLSRSLEKGLRNRLDESEIKPDLSSGYALFALHYEPERTSVPEGYPIISQLDAVALARKILPEEITLLVKEHASQGAPALRGFAGRSQFAYDLISALPNARLVGAKADTSLLLNGAKCVFTLTGTIGIEAASRGIPVAYFGFPWWQGLPGTTRVSQATSFDLLSPGTNLNPQTVTRKLVQMMKRRAVLGICSEDPADYQARNGTLDPGFWELSARAIAKEIVDIVS